jgi:hypothetical protein
MGGPLAMLRGKTLEVTTGFLSTGGIAGGITATAFHADLIQFAIVTGLPQLPGLAVLGMLWGRQRHEQRMEQKRDQTYQEIAAKALENQRDEHLRSLMWDYTATCPGHWGNRGSRGGEEEPTGDPGKAKDSPGHPVEDPPALTSVDQTAS